MSKSKRDFLFEEAKKIEMNKAFIEALNVMKKAVKEQKLDGKVANKRFIDKMDAAFNENGLEGKMRAIFDTDYRGMRKNRINLLYLKRDIPENRSCLDYYSSMCYLYFEQGHAYIDEDSYRINEENFIKVADKEIGLCEDKIKESQRCIAEIDQVIQKYKDLRKYVNETMESMPATLRKYIETGCPVYE